MGLTTGAAAKRVQRLKERLQKYKGAGEAGSSTLDENSMLLYHCIVTSGFKVCQPSHNPGALETDASIARLEDSCSSHRSESCYRFQALESTVRQDQERAPRQCQHEAQRYWCRHCQAKCPEEAQGSHSD
jgi:hypothetical protein